MNVLISYIILILLYNFPNCEQITMRYEDSECHPLPNSSLPQFVIGYGSFMNEYIKIRYTENVGASIPVLVSGFERLWGAQGIINEHAVTILGSRSNSDSKFNAALFEVMKNVNDSEDEHALSAFDQNEPWYCRTELHPSQIEFLTSNSTMDNDPENAQYWIYLTKQNYSSTPNKEHPILVSYVDVFIYGCLELGNRYKIDDFGSQCAKTTNEWGIHWLNNRYEENPSIISEIETLKQMWNRVDTVLENSLKNEFQEHINRLKGFKDASFYLGLAYLIGFTIYFGIAAAKVPHNAKKRKTVRL